MMLNSLDCVEYCCLYYICFIICTIFVNGSHESVASSIDIHMYLEVGTTHFYHESVASSIDIHMYLEVGTTHFYRLAICI